MRGTRQIFKLGYFSQIYPKRVATRQRVLRVKSLNWATFFKFFLRQWPRVIAWYASNL